MGLAGAADIVVCSGQATFQFPEVFFGLAPALAMVFLCPQRISRSAAKSLALSGRKLSAREAVELGLADRVAASGAMEKLLRDVLKSLLRASPGALAETKRLCADAEGTDFQRRLTDAQASLLRMLRDPSVMIALRSADEEGGLPYAQRLELTMRLASGEST